jgi:hypothetical protein
VPIAAASLLSPAGPITPTLFPGEDSLALTARLSGYLTAAYDDARVAPLTPDTTKDKGARALALSTAFTDVYIRMNAEANAVNVTEKGSTTYTDKQRENIKALADGYLAELDDLIVVPAGDAVVRGTTSVPTRFTW